tara:strand:- start:825 stop:1223 length:399 start_codon:yes stop_codon:yes gene_type:complete
MRTNQKISTFLILRRLFAGFVLFSIAFGIIDDLRTGNFTGESVSGALVGLVIVYFLSRIPNSLRTSTNEDVITEKIEKDEDIYDEETLEEFEKFDSEYTSMNKEIKNTNSYNPVKDEENILTRMFKGRTDRY